MNVVHRVTGYDKRTERMMFEFEISSDRLAEVRSLAHAPAEQHDGFASLPLDEEAARSISLRLQLGLNPEACDWFLEPFAVN